MNNPVTSALMLARLYGKRYADGGDVEQEDPEAQAYAPPPEPPAGEDVPGVGYVPSQVLAPIKRAGQAYLELAKTPREFLKSEAPQMPERGDLTEEDEYLRRLDLAQASKKETDFGAETAMAMFGTSAPFATPGMLGVAGTRLATRRPTNLMSLNRTHSFDQVLDTIQGSHLSDALSNRSVTLRQAGNINRLLEANPERLAEYLSRDPNPNVLSWMSRELLDRVRPIMERNVNPRQQLATFTDLAKMEPGAAANRLVAELGGNAERINRTLTDMAEAGGAGEANYIYKELPNSIRNEIEGYQALAGKHPESENPAPPENTGGNYARTISQQVQTRVPYPWAIEQRQWFPAGGLSQSTQDFLHQNVLQHYNGDFKKFADSFFGNMYNPRYVGMSGYGNTFSAYGNFVLPTGGGGYISRRINLGDGQTPGFAYHALFELPFNTQASGIGKTFLANQVDLYRKMGLSYVKTTANINIGSYSWGRYGFLPFDDFSWHSLAGKIGQNITRHLDVGTIPANVAEEFRNIISRRDLNSLWDFVDSPTKLPIDMQRGRKTKWAQELIMGIGWNAKLNLLDPATMRRFDAYVGQPR